MIDRCLWTKQQVETVGRIRREWKVDFHQIITVSVTTYPHMRACTKCQIQQWESFTCDKPSSPSVAALMEARSSGFTPISLIIDADWIEWVSAVQYKSQTCCAGVLLLLLSIAGCVLYYYYHTVFVQDCAHLISNMGVKGEDMPSWQSDMTTFTNHLPFF